MSRNADTVFGSLSWVELAPESPAPTSRVGHSLTFVEGNLYLFGGKSEFSASNELYQYHAAANAWTRLRPGGPSPPRLFHHSTVSHDRKLFVFGGSLLSQFSLWVFDFDVWEWSRYDCRAGSPANRHSQSTVNKAGVVFLFGGFTHIGAESAELWTYNLDENSWSEIARKEGAFWPGPMFGHSAVLGGSTMWVYGGTSNRIIQDTLWSFDTDSYQWSSVSRSFSPPGLYYHIALVVSDVMLIYGGAGEDMCNYGGMWRFHLERHEWTQMLSTELPGLFGHAVALAKMESQSNMASSSPAAAAAVTVITDVTDDVIETSDDVREEAIEERAVPLTAGDIELRPISTKSNGSHYSLPGMVDTPPWEDDGGSGTDNNGEGGERLQHHRYPAVYENRNVCPSPKAELCIADPEVIYPPVGSVMCVSNPLYSEESVLEAVMVSSGGPTPGAGAVAGAGAGAGASEDRRGITFLDKALLAADRPENSDSGSQGSRSSLRKRRKKKFKRGSKTVFYIVGHSSAMAGGTQGAVLYRCEIA